MPTNSTDESSTAVTEIAANGDVILIVGLDKRRLQVDSICLKKASKYFRVMFGPHFSEGQDLGGNSPKEVLMLDDNANVLEIICNIIHLRNDAVPEILTPDEVFEIAIAADKFDCGIALKHATALWLNPRDVKGIVELGRLMAAAYMLDNARAFGEITLSMILRHKESYLLLLDETAGIIDFVPWKILILLEERRNQRRTELQGILFDRTTSAGEDDNPSCNCGWSSQHCLAYIKRLQKEEVSPSHALNSTISEVVEKLEIMDDPTMPREWVKRTYRWHQDPMYRLRLSWSMDTFKKRNGICIDCVKSSTAAAKEICRIKH